ncbi:MAG: 3-hydroxyacyl-ACP dehydratase FabZ [Pseudomonadota bacterium]
MTDSDAQAGKTLESIDIMRLMELLPHRYPFLMVDKIVDIQGDQYARGIKNVTFNEPHFLGHFPNEPIMPGVLIIEGMAQAAGAICAEAHYNGKTQSVYFMTIDKAKFRKKVVPGDVLEYILTKQKQKRNVFKFFCTAEVDGVKVAEAEVGAMMVPSDE